MKTNSALWAAIQAIANRWKSRQKDIKSFAKTGYSFEEWLNWEAFCACKHAGLKPEPKPNYNKFGKGQLKTQADLVLKLHDGQEVLVEVGLVHDGTYAEKWLCKLKSDREKLLEVKKQYLHRVQIVLNACWNAKKFKQWNADLLTLHEASVPYSDFWRDNDNKAGRVLVWEI